MSFEVDLDSAVLESDYYKDDTANKPERKSTGFNPEADPAKEPAPFSVDLESAELDEKANQGVIGTLVDGAKSTARAINSTYNTYTGDGPAVVDNAKEQELANDEKSQDIKNFQSDFAANTGAGTDEEVGLWGAIKGTGKAIIDNPRGAALSVVEQFPNSVPTLAAGWAGAKGGAMAGGAVGSAFGVVGAGPGALIGGAAGFVGGMFLGNTLTETGHKAQEYAADGEFTPDEQSAAMTEGAKKAGVITAVDALTFALGGKVSGFYRKTAESTVEAATRKTLLDAGVDISDTAALTAARGNPQIASQVVEAQKNAAKIADNLRKRAGEAGALLTMETVGEGLGEYLGELAATGQASVSEAVLESFLSLGQSSVQSMFNFAKAREKSLTEQEWIDASNGIAPEGMAPEQMPVADGIWDKPTPEAKIDMGQMQGGGVTPTPVFDPQDIDRNLGPTPSQQMGINPDAGPLSAAAAQSVDSGLFVGGFTPQAGINQAALEREGVSPPPVFDTDQIDRNLGSIDPLTGEYIEAPAKIGSPANAGKAPGNYEYDQWGNLSKVDGRAVEGYGQDQPRLGFNNRPERSAAPSYEVGPDGVARPTTGEKARSMKERVDLSSLGANQKQAAPKQQAQQPAAQRTPEQDAQSIWDNLNTFERNAAVTKVLGMRGVPAKNAATKAWDKLSAEQQAKLVSGLDAQQGQRWTDPNQKVTDQTGPVLQNRDRTSQDSINQMRGISNNPDYSRLKTSGFLSDGAPVAIDENIKVPASQLGVTDTASAGGKKFNVQYAVVEADQFVTSNSIDGRPNTEYAAGSAGKARAIAGNGRITGLQSAWAKGKADQYKADMAADKMHGIDAAVIEGMKNPILVRLLPQDQVTDNIGDLSNRDEKGKLSPVEQAKTDMGRIDLDSLKFTAEGAIGGEAIHQFRMAQPAAERVSEADARKRLTSAIFQKAYGNDQLTEIQSGESDDAKSIMSALAQAAPSMSRLEGAGEFDVRPLITQAGIAAVNAARRGTKLADYVQQSEMGIDPMVYPILEMMLNEHGNIRSSKYIGEQLTNMAKLAYDEANSPSSDMFGEKPKRTAEQVIQDALTGVQGYGQINDGRGQESLGQRGRSEPDAQMVEGPEGGRERPADTRQTAPTQPETEQEQPAAVESNAPETWRSNYIQAAKIAREKGIDPKQHKKLADLVAAIDASNTKPEAQTQLPAQQKQAAGSVDGAKVHINNSVDLTSALAAIARGAQLSTEPNGDVILSGTKIITLPKQPTSVDEVIGALAVALRDQMRADGVSMPGNPAEMTRDQFVVAYEFANIIPEFEITGEDIGGVVQGSNSGLTVDADKLYDKIIEQAKEQAKPALKLNQQTEESLAKDAERLERLQKEEAAQKAKQKAAESKARERDADKARADEVVDDFQLGQQAEEVMSGMGDIFATENKPEKAAKTPAESIASAIDGLIEEQNAIIDDWKSREYKNAKGSVEFEGDGPSAKGSMSINAINEGRRRKAIEQATHTISAARKLKDKVLREGSENLLSQSAVIFNTEIAGNENPTSSEKDAMFEARFLRSIDFDGKQSGATQSNSLSKVMLVAVKDHIQSKGAEKQKQIEAEAKLQKDFEADTRSTEELISDFFDDKTKQPTTNAPTGAIEDFGEKMAGAIKDQPINSLSKNLTDEEMASQPLSALWPVNEPLSIEDNYAAAFSYAARQNIPAKPRLKYKVKRWVDAVKSMREIAKAVQDGEITKDNIGALSKINDTASSLAAKANLLSGLDRKHWSRIGRVDVSDNAFIFDENRNKVPSPHTVIVVDGRSVLVKGKYDNDSVTAVIKASLEMAEQSDASKRGQFEIRQNRNTGEIFINRKGDKEYRKLKTFPKGAIKEARDFVNNNTDELVAEWEAIKERDNVTKADVRSDTNKERTGIDYRNGKDVTSEEFAETFGFRGVEFGNWVSQGKGQKDRQGMLNAAYDALLDLAAVVGIPPKAVSLNSSLGIAFGSRGKGKASAHYETDNIVINLTKTKGAGSLAHEWFHALDNYFSRRRGVTPFDGNQAAYNKANYITYKPEPMMALKTSLNKKGLRPHLITKAEYDRRAKNGVNFDADSWTPDTNHPIGVRPVVEKAFAELVSELDKSPMLKRSEIIDKGKVDGYWSSIIERAARSFESYVIQRLEDQGITNDYLANVVSIEQFQRNAGRYPYLTPEELKPVAEKFDTLFSTIETREEKRGNFLMFSRHNNQPNNPTTNASLLKNINDSYPALTDSVVTMLQRGRKGQKGGLVIVDSNNGADIAKAYSEATGMPIAQANRLFSDGESINGFYDTKSGITFLVGPNLDAVTAPAVLLHEVTHSQQRSEIDARSMKLINGRAKEKNADLKTFLETVSQRMIDAGEYGNPLESTTYIVEQAIIEGRSQGYTLADSKFLNAIEKTLGSTVASIVRDFTKMVRQFALRRGLPINITIDDLVQYAMASVEQASRGNVDGGVAGFSRDATASLEDALAKLDALGLKHQVSERNDVITVSKIEVPEGARGQGAGSAAMQALIDYADATGKHIALTPTADFGGNKTRLKEFYQRFGFKENKGKNKVYEVSESMVRENSDGRTLYSKAGATTNTPAFKRWFGDSKVVDGNGKPLIVHHGSGTRFTVFDKNKLGSTTGADSAKEGFFFTSEWNLANMFRRDTEGSGVDLAQLRRVLADADEKVLQRIGEDFGYSLDVDLELEGREYFVDAVIELYEKDVSLYTAFDDQNGMERILKNNLGREFFEPGAVLDVYLKIEDPYVLEFDDDSDQFYEDAITNAIKKAKRLGKDGVILKNMVDSAKTDDKGNRVVRSDVYVVFEPTQIKSATDNNGDFDGSNPDIRYSKKQAYNPNQGDLFAELEKISNDDPYAKTKQRPGTTEKQREIGRSALTDFFRWLKNSSRAGGDKAGSGSGEVSLLGASIYKDLQAGKPYQLIGQTIESPKDLAALAQVYRDPRFETFRAFFVDKDGKIILEQAASTRMPASVSFSDDLYMELERSLENSGADKFYIMHNHPSGVPTPSTPDIAMTEHMRKVFGKRMAAHVVIDHNSYAVIDESGNVTEHQDERLAGIDFSSNPEVDHASLNKQINSPDQMALVAKQVAHSDTPIVVVTKAGSVSRVGLIASVPMDLLNKGNSGKQDPKFTAAVRRMIRAAGTGGALFVVLPKSYGTKGEGYHFEHGSLQWMHEFAQDVVDSDGNSVIFVRHQVSVDDYASVSIKDGRTSKQKAIMREEAGAFNGSYGLNEPNIQFSKSKPKQDDMFSSDFAGKRAKGNINSDGNQVVQTKQALKNFNDWFKDSKAVDSKGRPLVMYHSTNADISTFEQGKKTKNNMGILGDVETARDGIFVTPDREFSQEYLRDGDGQNVMPLYLSAKNPADLRSGVTEEISNKLSSVGYDARVLRNLQNMWEAFDHGYEGYSELVKSLKDAGYDSAIISEEGSGGVEHDTYVAFDSSQLKSVTGNQGSYRGGDVHFSRAANPASIGAAPNGMAAWDSPSASKFDDFVYKMQDKHVDTKRVIEAIRDTGKAISDDLDVYLQETLFHGRAAKRTQDFLNKEVNPLIEYMQSAKVEMSDLEEFLHARHAQEANALIAKRDPNMPDGGSGMTNAEAAKYLKSLNGVRRKQLENAAKFVDKIIGGTRETIVNYGLESQETVDGWTAGFKHYIPLQREDKDGQMGIGQGFSVKGKETKGRTGSTRKVVDILANVMMQRERAIVRGEKNRVAVALLGLAKDNPLPEFWQVDKVPTTRVLDKVTGLVRNQADPMYKSRDNAIVAKVNGQEHAILMNEDDPRAMRMAEALKNLDAAQLEGLLGATATATRYFAAVNTQYNPIFGVTNFVRDIQEAMLHLQSTPLAGQQARLFKNTFTAVGAVMKAERDGRKGNNATGKWGVLWEDFQNTGGQTGFRDQFSSSADRGDAIKNALTPGGWADTGLGKLFTAGGVLKVPLEVARKKAAWLFDLLSDYNTAMENGVRLSAYETGINAGMSKEQAAALAKGLTVNFNRKGQVTQQVGALYAFFNASVQGTARLGQSLFDMDAGKPKTLRLSSLGKKIVSGGVMLGASQAVLLAMAGFDDEEPPEFIRERNIIIPTGGKTYISIPMPLGYHVIANLGRIPMEFVLGGGKDGAKYLFNLMDVMADIYNPIGNSGLSMQTIAPTVLDPLAGLAENKDFSGRAIAKESFNRQTPGHALARDTASLPATWLAELVNYATGGTEFTRGELSPTPDQIDYLVGQLTGGVGRETTKFMKSIQATATGDDLPWHNIPLAGRFFGDADSDGAKQSAFYSSMDKVRKHAEEVKGLRASGRSGEAVEYANKHPHAKLHLAARAAEKQVKDMRDRKRDLEQAGAPREEIRALEKRMIQRMEQFVELSAVRK